MKLKKDINKYSDKELKIFIQFLNKKALNDKLDIQENITNLEYIVVESQHSIDDFEFMINNIEKITDIYINSNKFKHSIFSCKGLNLRQLVCQNFIFDDNTITDFIKNNNVESIYIKESHYKLDTLYTYNLNDLYIDESCDINNLKYLESDNLVSLALCTKNSILDKKVEWNNKNIENMESFASVGLIVKNINPIKYIGDMYIEILKHSDLVIDNISRVGNITVNKVDFNKLDLSRIDTEFIEVLDSNINNLILDRNIQDFYINKNNNINSMNIFTKEYNKAFINYFKTVVNKLKNNTLDDKTRYEYIKFVKENRDIFNNLNGDNIENSL